MKLKKAKSAKESNNEQLQKMIDNMDPARRKEVELFLKSLATDINKLSMNNQILGMRNMLAHNISTLPKRTKNIKVDVNVWTTLNDLKEGEQTFNDVIIELLGLKTRTKGDKNLLAIKYKRKRSFFTTEFAGKELGCEFEYNDSKGVKQDFSFDIKIKKIFIGKQTMTPSEFYGVDNTHKHYSEDFLLLYLQCVTMALQKEFRISFKQNATANDYENLVLWRKLYYDYSLSEDSFTSDVEDPLRLSEKETVSKDWESRIAKSKALQMKRAWKKKQEQQLSYMYSNF